MKKNHEEEGTAAGTPRNASSGLERATDAVAMNEGKRLSGFGAFAAEGTEDEHQ
jgi:hypothetical protein